MKKIISSAVLLTVLVGAVTMIVGCGEKPTKESVWSNPHSPDTVNTPKVIAFHSDGCLYVTRVKTAGNPVVLETVRAGKYSINAASKTITISDYTTGTKLATLDYTDNQDILKITKSTDTTNFPIMTLKKNPNVSAEDLKKVAKLTP